MKRGYIPALVLAGLTPLIAEYLLGSLSFAQIEALPVLCLMYGGGAVLIRESARATRRGWPAIVVLGIAFAIIEEAFATGSLFNPHYLGLRLLDYGYLPTLGISPVWTVYVISLHVIWSVCVPIGIVEALFARRGGAPWLGLIGRIAFGLLLIVGVVAVSGYTRRSEHFTPTTPQLATAAVFVVALLVPVLRGGAAAEPAVPAPSTGGRTDAPALHELPAPHPVVVGAFALATGSAFELTQTLQGLRAPWPFAVLAMLLVSGFGAFVLKSWSQTRTWGAVHRFAAAAGGLLVYCWWGFRVEVMLHGRGGLVPHSILVALAILLVIGIALRFHRPSGDSVA